jgi:hypothetical protein
MNGLKHPWKASARSGKGADQGRVVDVLRRVRGSVSVNSCGFPEFRGTTALNNDILKFQRRVSVRDSESRRFRLVQEPHPRRPEPVDGSERCGPEGGVADTGRSRRGAPQHGTKSPSGWGRRDNRFSAYREEERGIGAVPALAGPIGVGRPVRHSSLPDVASLTWGRPRGNHPGRGNGPVRVN